jgi:hypothetical protein
MWLWIPACAGMTNKIKGWFVRNKSEDFVIDPMEEI